MSITTEKDSLIEFLLCRQRLKSGRVYNPIGLLSHNDLFHIRVYMKFIYPFYINIPNLRHCGPETPIILGNVPSFEKINELLSNGYNCSNNFIKFYSNVKTEIIFIIKQFPLIKEILHNNVFILLKKTVYEWKRSERKRINKILKLMSNFGIIVNNYFPRLKLVTDFKIFKVMTPMDLSCQQKHNSGYSLYRYLKYRKRYYLNYIIQRGDNLNLIFFKKIVQNYLFQQFGKQFESYYI